MDTNQGTISSLNGLFAQAWLTAQAYALGRLYGEEFGYQWAELHRELYTISPAYRRAVDAESRKIANGLFEADPENFIVLLSQPDASELLAELYCEGIDQNISSQFAESQLAEMQNAVASLLQQLPESLAGTEWDGKSTVADELDVDLETLAREPWRLGKVFPIHRLDLRKNEIRNLKEALNLGSGLDESGNDNYDQTLLSLITQLALSPQDARGDGFQSNSPIYKWAGVKKSTPESPGTLEDATTAVVNLLKFSTQQENRRRILQHFIARMFRNENGIGAGRGFDSHSSEGFEDTLHNGGEEYASTGFEQVEARMMLEWIGDEASSKQKEALEIYVESFESGRTIEELCNGKSLKPVNVRNNLQALMRKLQH